MTTTSWFTVKTLQNNSKREKPVGHATHTFLHSANIKHVKAANGHLLYVSSALNKQPLLLSTPGRFQAFLANCV